MKKLLTLSVILNILLISAAGFILWKKYLRNTPALRVSTRISLFDVLPDDTCEIVFLGTSITEKCELAELFDNPNIKNRGISSETTTGASARLAEVTRSMPDKIFIELGINDLIKRSITPEITNNYIAIINHIRSDSPNTKVFIQSVLPVADNPVSNDSIQVLNSLLRGLADSTVTYIDIYSSFALNGQMNPMYSSDGVHPNGQGYLLLKQLLLPYLED
jgi:lysophospholipase L1-like esterase